MRALLLAAGFGSRLRPLTDHTPKCLIEIAGRPLLDYWLENLHAAGFREFIINTHYLSAKVQQFVSQHRFCSIIKLVHEPTLLGTAGTLIANRVFLEQGCTLVAHADNLCICPWTEFIQAHRSRPQNAIMTMMTFRTSSPSDCGIVEVDQTGVVQAFHEKIPNPPGNLANAAVYLLEPEFIKHITSLENDIHDLSTQVLPFINGHVNTWTNNHVLIDIGTPERLDYARGIIECLEKSNCVSDTRCS